MGRNPKSKGLKRVQLRLDSSTLEVCDRLTSDELSQIVEVAIKNGIRSNKPLGSQIQAIIRPEKLITKTITRITVTGATQHTVQIMFAEKREDFRALMHQFLYKWSDPFWSRSFDQRESCDRVSEIAHNLLLNGFAVQTDHSEIRDRAVTGQYEPESFRLIKLGAIKPYDGWFVFEYPRADDFYSKLMRLTGAKYADGRVRFVPEHFAEVEDFAEQNGFQFSAKARNALEDARSLWESALLVLPAKKKDKKKAANPLDNVEVEIPDALKDDLT